MKQKAARNAIVRCIKKGKVKLAPQKKAALGRMKRTGKPDFTVVEASIFGMASNVLVVDWGTKSAGFGQLTILFNNNKLTMQTENMGLDFAKEVMSKLLETAEITE